METFKQNLIDNKQLLTFIFFLLVIASCNSTNNENISTNSVNNIVSNLLTQDKLDAKKVSTELLLFLENNKKGFLLNNDSVKNVQELIELYNLHNNETFWINNKGISKNAEILLEKIATLKDDGINPEKYHLSELQTEIKNFTSNFSDSLAKNIELGLCVQSLKASKNVLLGSVIIDSFYEDWFSKNDTNFVAKNYINQIVKSDSVAYIFENLLPKNKEYSLLKNKLKTLDSIAVKGGWDINFNVLDSSAIASENIAALRKRLFIETGLPKDTNNTNFTLDLQAAIVAYQHLHDLKLTGKIDTATKRWLNTSVDEKIKIVKNNLERLRWLKKDMPQPYVWVNIPSMELKYLDKDSIQFKMRVVVGRTSRETPPLDAAMTNIVFNPGWSVPPTIMKEEIVPGISKRGGSYLSRRGLKAYYHGHVVDASRINANNYKSFAIQQQPGLNSSLGAVKFNLPNRHAIYLHDTPHRGDFVKYYRAYSSGCIRVEKPRDFAAFILNDTNYTRDKIDTLVKKKTTKEVPLKKNVDVHIVYLTNGLDSLGNVMFLRDIYKKDEKMKSMWN